MKILISGLDQGGMGGAENFLYWLGRDFQKKGHTVEFIAYRNSQLEEFLDKNKQYIRRFPLRMDILGGWRGLVKFFIFLPYSLVKLFFILRSFKKEKGNLIIIPGFSDKLILSPVAKILGLKAVWIEFAPLKSLFVRNLYTPYLFYQLVKEIPEIVVACSKNTKKSLLNDADISKDVIRVIPCGIELLSSSKVSSLRKKRKAKRKELGVENKFVIGMVSRVDEREKGQDTLLEAASLLENKYDNLSYLIVGGGDQRFIKSKIKSLDLEDKVSLLGFRDDLFEVIAAFDVFVFPTRWKLEGFGLVLLEAMTLKVPIVASNFGPVPEVVGDAGLMVKPSAEEVARGIERIFNKRKTREMLVIRGSERVRKFNIDNISNRYLNIFLSLK